MLATRLFRLLGHVVRRLGQRCREYFVVPEVGLEPTRGCPHRIFESDRNCGMVRDAALRGALMSLFASLCGIVRVEVVAVQDTSVHQKSERTWSRKVGFRQIPFLETRISILASLGKVAASFFCGSDLVPDPTADTPPLARYRRFANASPGPAELPTPSPRTLRIWRRVAVRRPDTTRRLGYGHDSQQSPRSWLAHSGIARYRRLSTLRQVGSILRIA